VFNNLYPSIKEEDVVVLTMSKKDASVLALLLQEFSSKEDGSLVLEMDPERVNAAALMVAFINPMYMRILNALETNGLKYFGFGNSHIVSLGKTLDDDDEDDKSPF